MWWFLALLLQTSWITVLFLWRFPELLLSILDCWRSISTSLLTFPLKSCCFGTDFALRGAWKSATVSCLLEAFLPCSSTGNTYKIYKGSLLECACHGADRVHTSKSRIICLQQKYLPSFRRYTLLGIWWLPRGCSKECAPQTIWSNLAIQVRQKFHEFLY